MLVIYTPATEQRRKVPNMKAEITVTKVMTIASLWQGWIAVHKAGCARKTTLLSITQASSDFEAWFWHDGGT